MGLLKDDFKLPGAVKCLQSVVEETTEVMRKASCSTSPVRSGYHVLRKKKSSVFEFAQNDSGVRPVEPLSDGERFLGLPPFSCALVVPGGSHAIIITRPSPNRGPNFCLCLGSARQLWTAVAADPKC